MPLSAQLAAFVTGRTQIQVLQKSVQIRVGCLRTRVRFAVFKCRDDGKILPSKAFIAERIGADAAAPLLLQFRQIRCEHPRRRHAVADEIHRQQFIRLCSAQRRHQAADLAGRAGKQHRNVPFQQRYRVADRIRCIALHIFGTAHAGELALVERPDVLDMQRLVKRRAEHHAALPNHLARKQREHAAGGRLPPKRLVLGLRAEQVRGMLRHFPPRRAALFAQVAGNALIPIHLRIQKTLRVRLHGDRLLRAYAHARAAARAFRRVLSYRLPHAHFPFAKSNTASSVFSCPAIYDGIRL